MAKKAYIGARGYTGETQNKTVSINDNNISTYFQKEDGEYTFVYGYGFWNSNNYCVSNSTAIMTLTALMDIPSVEFEYSYSTEKSFDLVYIKIGDTMIVDGGSGEHDELISCSGSLTKGQCIEFKYTKDGSNDGGNDSLSITNITITAKVPILGDNYATNIKKAYIGINNIARRIRKAYIGIDGVARQYFHGYFLEYYGVAATLSIARYGVSATTVGNYALFAGGHDGNTYSSVVDAYDTSLVRSTITPLGIAKSNMCGVTVGNYALFAAGQTSSTGTNTIYVYDTSLTYSTTSLYTSMTSICGTSIGDYAIFAGGTASSGSTGNLRRKYVYAYNTNLTKTQLSNLPAATADMAATIVGNYALFGGGRTDSYGYSTTNICAYNTSLTQKSCVVLGLSRYNLGAATTGTHAIFAGGYNWGNDNTILYTNYVDAYNSSLTKYIPDTLLERKHMLTGGSLKNYALFVCGELSVDTERVSTTTVDCFDDSLTHTNQKSLSRPSHSVATTTIKNYALFGGGYNTNDDKTSNMIEAYTV